MKIKLFFVFLFLLAGVKVTKGRPLIQAFNKSDFYNVMKSGGIEEINNQLVNLGSVSINEKDAYAGALLMKKAGLIKKPKDKLNLFKSGYKKLETELVLDSSNVEYHFLRLSIQEHAPKIVKDHDQLEHDGAYIKKYFKNLSEVVQKAVIDSSKTSNVLNLQDF